MPTRYNLVPIYAWGIKGSQMRQKKRSQKYEFLHEMIYLLNEMICFDELSGILL